MEIYKIEKIELSDIHRLQSLSRQTFIETFASVNSEENMKKYLEEEFSIEKLSSELKNMESVFYFIKLDEQVIGYLKLNFGQSQTEIPSEQGMEMERIYVLEEFHGKKAGQFLFDQALQIGKEKQLKYIWLGVWEKNHKAIRFYEKNGFTAFDTHLFKLGDDVQTDMMMKLFL